MKCYIRVMLCNVTVHYSTNPKIVHLPVYGFPRWWNGVSSLGNITTPMLIPRVRHSAAIPSFLRKIMSHKVCILLHFTKPTLIVFLYVGNHGFTSFIWFLLPNTVNSMAWQDSISVFGGWDGTYAWGNNTLPVQCLNLNITQFEIKRWEINKNTSLEFT